MIFRSFPATSARIVAPARSGNAFVALSIACQARPDRRVWTDRSAHILTVPPGDNRHRLRYPVHEQSESPAPGNLRHRPVNGRLNRVTSQVMSQLLKLLFQRANGSPLDQRIRWALHPPRPRIDTQTRVRRVGECPNPAANHCASRLRAQGVATPAPHRLAAETVPVDQLRAALDAKHLKRRQWSTRQRDCHGPASWQAFASTCCCRYWLPATPHRLHSLQFPPDQVSARRAD